MSRASSDLKLPQARVLAVLLPPHPEDPEDEWPLITRATLGVRSGYTAVSGSVTRALHGIRQGSSSGPASLGLLDLGLVVAIELDVVRWHLPSHTFEADHRKRARLQAAGWTVLAFTWRMLMDEPGAVVRAIRSVLGRQGARNVHPDGPKQMAERPSAGTACATGPRSA